MSNTDLPSSWTDLEPELELLRSKGINSTAVSQLPALAYACIRLRFVDADGEPDLERLVRAVVNDLRASEVGRSAFALFGLSDTTKEMNESIREAAAARA